MALDISSVIGSGFDAASVITVEVTTTGGKPILVCTPSTSASGDTLDSVVLSDVTLEELTSGWGTEERRCHAHLLYIADAPSSGTHNLVATWSGAVRGGIVAAELTEDPHATTPVRDVAVNTGDTPNADASAVSVEDGDVLICGVSAQNPESLDAGATSHFSNDLGGPAGVNHVWAALSSKTISSSGTDDTGYTGDSPSATKYAEFNLSLVPAAAGGGANLTAASYHHRFHNRAG